MEGSGAGAAMATGLAAAALRGDEVWGEFQEFLFSPHTAWPTPFNFLLKHILRARVAFQGADGQEKGDLELPQSTWAHFCSKGFNTVLP